MSAKRKGLLRLALELACMEGDEHGKPYTMGDLTVLANQHDPYRLDTPANHRDGEWLGKLINQHVGTVSTVYLRGLHYLSVSVEATLPDGTPYLNDDATWVWMSEKAAKAARWLGYVDFERIVDKRNAAPVIRIRETEEPSAFVSPGEVAVYVPESIEPQARADGFVARQPYRLVIFGEKSSLDEVVGPIAERYDADLYLPTGEISDTLLYTMARVGDDDGRPMVVLCLSDCDPAGWQMPISIARKLQALKEREFPSLDVQVRRVALTPDHVRAYDLPSTPLKASEKRADRWRELMGVQQTEIDALATLRPDLLRTFLYEAIAPFYDDTLDDRVEGAREEWEAEAHEALDDHLGEARLERLREEAGRLLDEFEQRRQAINDLLDVEVGEDFEFPEIVVPEAEIDEEPDDAPLFDSGDDYTDATLKLKASRAYEEEE